MLNAIRWLRAWWLCEKIGLGRTAGHTLVKSPRRNGWTAAACTATCLARPWPARPSGVARRGCVLSLLVERKTAMRCFGRRRCAVRFMWATKLLRRACRSRRNLNASRAKGITKAQCLRPLTLQDFLAQCEGNRDGALHSAYREGGMTMKAFAGQTDLSVSHVSRFITAETAKALKGVVNANRGKRKN